MLVNISHDAKMNFADFIDAVIASRSEKPGPYMYRSFIGPHLPELLPDVQPQNVYAFPGRLASPLMPRMWRRPDGWLKLLIGGVGGRFPFMHYDGENMHACITEIYGEKEFIMYSPEDTPYLYPISDPLSLTTQISDIQNPDFKRFPLLAKARRYSTILCPGEMIFVPSRWWHTVRVVSTSISVCQNMLNRSNWQGYVKWVSLCEKRRIRRLIKFSYLSSLGAVLSLLEIFPLRGTQSRPSWASRLAPKNASEALDYLSWRIDKWIVR